MWNINDIPPRCSNRFCMKEAECTEDDVPYCIACADLSLERFVLVSIHPGLRDQLPPLWEDILG